MSESPSTLNKVCQLFVYMRLISQVLLIFCVYFGFASLNTLTEVAKSVVGLPVNAGVIRSSGRTQSPV